MRRLLLLFVIAIATIVTCESDYEPWVEEEDVDGNYDDMYENQDRSRRDVHPEEYEPGPYRREINDREEIRRYRKRRDAYEIPVDYSEHVRVKRRYDEPERPRYEEIRRVPRQVHQYEVHEFTDENSPQSVPYEEMLAASAEHYHRLHAAPGAPSSARYLSPDVSSPNLYSPTQFVNPPVQSHVSPVPVHNPVPAALNVASVNVAPSTVQVPPPVGFIPIVGPVQLAEDDQSVAAAAHHKKHSHGHSQGGGHGKRAHHHASRGGKSNKGYNNDQHVDKGTQGYKTDELHRKKYEEAEGKQKKHHDHADHKGDHEEEAHGHRGAKFDEKKGHKKGHKTKGYHNKYHKDEFHKEHKFYDDFHKSGEHHRYGKFNAKHATNESGKKKAHHVNAGHDFMEKGKKGYSNAGHMDSDHRGHKGKHGHEEHSAHHEQHGKKGGKEGGSHWGYKKN